MALPDIAGYLLIGGFVLLFVGAAVAWGFAAFYMVKTLKRFHPDRRWGQFLPVCYQLRNYKPPDVTFRSTAK